MTLPAQMSPTVERLPAVKQNTLEILPAVERVTLHTTAAIIEGPARLGPVADPGAVRAAVTLWASALYEADAAKRAWIDCHVLKAQAHTLQALPDQEAPHG